MSSKTFQKSYLSEEATQAVLDLLADDACDEDHNLAKVAMFITLQK